MRSPAKSLPNQEPASNWRSSASVCSCTAPRPLVVRSSVSRSEEHTSELQSRLHLVCRLLLEKKKKKKKDLRYQAFVAEITRHLSPKFSDPRTIQTSLC